MRSGTREPADILVGARRRGDDIVFEVRDNGRGMTQEKVDRVFEALKVPTFNPVGYSAARSGLGLYNVRLFTERMGGTVECKSAPEVGTLFRVLLPGPVHVLAPSPLARTHRSLTHARAKFVAILDDDEQVLRTTERVFESLGIEVYADSDPLRWLNVVTEMKRMPDLFLLDFQLKGQDCSLQLDIVRRKWGDAMPKVIVVTGHGESQALKKISTTVPVLRKPLSDPKFELILDVLFGTQGTPRRWFPLGDTVA